MRRRRKLKAELRALHQELDVLRAENARLRVERQTPASLGAVGDRTRALLSAVSELDGEDRADAEASVLANAAMIRSSVLAVCEELQTTFAQLQRRLQTGVPPAELDRRIGDRRAVGARDVDATPVLVPRGQPEGRAVSELVRLSAAAQAGGREAKVGATNGSKGAGRTNGSNGHGTNGHSTNGHGSNGHGGAERLAEGA